MAEALRLADALEAYWAGANGHDRERQAAAELRRLHAENERLHAQRDALLEALKALLARDEKNTCRHEETHRGGAIWEICDSCGSMWADDEGGKPEWEDPKEWTQARAAIAAAEGEKNHG